MTGGAEQEAGVSDPLRPSTAARPGASRPERPRHGLACFSDRAGGVLVPLAATFLAFLVGGIVVARHRPQPARRLQGDLRRHRPNWFFPGDGGTRRGGARPPADADHHDAAVLTGARGRLRVPLRHVQHRRPGPVLGRALIAAICVGTHLDGTPPAAAHRPRDRRRRSLAGAVWAGIAGILKATVGAHEVITTIMLNWIAI